MENTVFRGNWMAAEEFAGREPVNVFHREMEKPTLP